MVIICPDVCVRFSCIRKFRFYCTIYFVGVANSVEIMGHVYITLVLLDCTNPYDPANHPLFLVFTLIFPDLVYFYMWPSFLLVNVTLLCPPTNLYPCIQQYPVGSNFDS